MSEGFPAALRRSVVERAASAMFIPISLEDYIQKHLAAISTEDGSTSGSRLLWGPGPAGRRRVLMTLEEESPMVGCIHAAN